MGKDFERLIKIKCDDPELKAQIEHALENFMKTPEGRKLIEEAYDVQNHRRLFDRRIVIEYNENAEKAGEANCSDGIITLGPKLKTSQYEGIDGQPYEMSLDRILFHELSHLADEEMYKDAKAAKTGIDEIRVEMDRTLLDAMGVYFGQKFSSMKEVEKYARANGIESLEDHMDEILPIYDQLEKQGKSAERRAIDNSNPYMSKYFGEMARKRHDDFGAVETFDETGVRVEEKVGTPELETYDDINPSAGTPPKL